MIKLSLSLAIATLTLGASAQNKLEQDRAAIKALAGNYKVTFNYAETFSPIKDYRFNERYRSSAKELALIIEDSPKKIVIQHLLVIRDSMVIKHWREDWTFEDPTLLVYQKNHTWKKTTINDVDGKWTQKVFQVDDSPRYEGMGTWTHVDGRHQWISHTDSPLPRREAEKRNDYNVLNRRNTIYLTEKGWMFEQDNKKINRSDTAEVVIAMEKGLEEFVKIDAKRFEYAQQWWKNQSAFWTDVRQSWDELVTKSDTIKLTEKVNGKMLFEQMFALGDQSEKEKWTPAKNKTEIRKVLGIYVKG